MDDNIDIKKSIKDLKKMFKFYRKENEDGSNLETIDYNTITTKEIIEFVLKSIKKIDERLDKLEGR